MRSRTTETIDGTAGADMAAIQEAVTELRRCRHLQLALEPVRQLIEDIDEQMRQAILQGELVGMSQRALASQAGVSQPSVKVMLDGRRNVPTPPPSLAEQVWGLHQTAAALDTLVRRLLGQSLPDRAPSNNHSAPLRLVRSAAESSDQTAKLLAAVAAALEEFERKAGANTR